MGEGAGSFNSLRLHEAIAENFDGDELKLLCVSAGINPDSVPFAERGKELFAYSIVETFRAQNNLATLLDACTKARGDVTWASFAVAQTVPARWAELFTDEASHIVAGLRSPYLGLRAFGYDDRLAYAGRERGIDEAVTRLTTPGRQQTVLFITGASGCGKSSFVQAGLLPALETHYQKRNQHVRKVVFRPGLHPQAMLDDARKQLAAQMGDVDVFVVDQFEELFTQSQTGEREALFAWISSFPSFVESNTHVVATLRSDYLKELFDAKAVWDLAMSNRVELRAMTVEELKDAIQQPLQALYPGARKRFEPALLDRLAQDASAGPTLLPLLQVTLDELWKKGALVLANYGTLTDAIKLRADQVLMFVDYDVVSPGQPRSGAEQAEVLSIFLDLISVTLDEDARQVRVSRATDSFTRDQLKLVEDLTRARLLSVSIAGETELVNIIHESLIVNWGRLQSAVREAREQLQQRTRFEAALRAWEAAGKTDDYLLTGIWLAQARALDEAADVAVRREVAREFLRKSAAQQAGETERQLAQARKLAEEQHARAEERSRSANRLRLALAGVLAIAIVALFAAFLAVTNAQQADRSRQAANVVALRTSGERAYQMGQYDLAQIFYRKALENYTYDFDRHDAEGMVISTTVNPLNKGDIYSLLSSACYQAGDFNCARSAIQEALKIDPNDPTYNLGSATILVKAKQYDNAKRALSRADMHREKGNLFWDLRIRNVDALIEFDQNHWSLVVQMLAPSLNDYPKDDTILSPSVATSLYMVAKSLEMLNKRDEACSYYLSYADLMLLIPVHKINIGEKERSDDVLHALSTLNCSGS